MKKFVAVILVSMFMVLSSVACAEIYPQLFEVESIQNDMMSLSDCTGNVWEWQGVEDYMVGDFVAAIMDDNGTESIYDDMIVTLKYVGCAEWWG